MWSRRWYGVPARVRRIVGAAVAVLAYGTGAHVGQLLIGGIDPYPTVPRWLALYFVSLTLLDALAAILLAVRRLEGLVLGCVILSTDAVANGYANYVLDRSDGITAGRVGQAMITALAVALLLAAPQVAPWLRFRTR